MQGTILLWGIFWVKSFILPLRRRRLRLRFHCLSINISQFNWGKSKALLERQARLEPASSSCPWPPNQTSENKHTKRIFNYPSACGHVHPTIMVTKMVATRPWPANHRLSGSSSSLARLFFGKVLHSSSTIETIVYIQFELKWDPLSSNGFSVYSLP